MSESVKKLTERDRLGKFLPGNKAGITDSERARELQKLSAAKRVENRRKAMHKALCLAFAEDNEWTALEKIYLNICLEAYKGNLSAALFIFKVMGYS